MPHSDDDFGLDDDDTEFLAAATQLERSQSGGFSGSDRPLKRRCLGHSPHADKNNDRLGGLAPQFEQDDDYYFDEELGQDENAKRSSKYKIHIPADGGVQYKDVILTQTQHGLDADPTALRGAIWKRPSVLSDKPSAINIAPRKTAAPGVKSTLRKSTSANGIANYFQVAPRTSSIEDDATLAAQLQDEEDRLARSLGSSDVRAIVNEAKSPHGFVEAGDNGTADIFSSSAFDDSFLDEVEHIGAGPAAQSHALRAPQTGLKQMTIFGQPATQALTISQAAEKRYAWPLRTQEEPPTHHKLDAEAMSTWIYPTNLGTTRDYQFNIVQRSLFHNTLVALPTGLGKTFIAATIMLNYYRWTTNAQIIFVAPTKPLIAQQMEACYSIVGMPRRDTVLMTGETTPAVRAEEWRDRRVFFMTPQTVINDLKTGICDPKKIVLLVVDEAHKATGGYAYTEVVSFVRRFNSSFRVLALTATPGSTVEGVQNVIDSLGIARVELRTEQSLDIRPYTFEKHTETELFDYSGEQLQVMELISKALQPSVDKLCQQNAYWSKDPMNLTAFGLTDQRRRWALSEAGRKAPMPLKGMINAVFTILSKIAHSLGLLKNHGIRPFYANMLAFQNSVTSGESKGKTATGIVQSDAWVKMMSMLRGWTDDQEFVGHPKLEYLREVVLGHFLDAGEGRHGGDVPPSATRVMVFASYRDSTEDICRVLKRNEPMIRPHVFVGQAVSKDSEGMNQKRQNEVIQDFKSGKYNVLIATSIGEEGLDIGTVDLIVNYDTSSSPIRMLQRNGRTARKRTGKVVLLLMRGKEERDYEKAQDTYIGIQKTIADESRYEYRDDQSRRIIPKSIQPVVDKRAVDIPTENSQPVDLNERTKKVKGRAKAKRPPKKFHMPDNVRTGFVRASKLGSDDDGASENDLVPTMKRTTATVCKATSTKAMASKASKEPATVPVPALSSILLGSKEQRDLENRFMRMADDSQHVVISDLDMTLHPQQLPQLGSTTYLGHGWKAEQVEQTMQNIHAIDEATVERWSAINRQGRQSTLYKAAAHRLVSAEASRQGQPVVDSDSDADLPSLPVSVVESTASAAKARSKPSDKPLSKTTATRSAPASKPRPTKRKLPRPTKTARKPGRVARAQDNDDGVSAMEAASSSPAPTPADMRLGTQGIDLGSDDTSGEDEDEDDSDLDGFIARSSDPVEVESESEDNEEHDGGDEDDEDDAEIEVDSRRKRRPKPNNKREKAKRAVRGQAGGKKAKFGKPSVLSKEIVDSDSEADDNHEANSRNHRTNVSEDSEEAASETGAVSSAPILARKRRRQVVQEDSDEE